MYGDRTMDRRQKKTRQAIFSAFIELLDRKDFSRITVAEIIDKADVGRATFYAHFETKDFLLREFCGEMFCHIFDVMNNEGESHHHIFTCEGESSAFLHLFKHLQKNDNNILKLLSGKNNELFLGYFRENLKMLVTSQLHLFSKKEGSLPDALRVNHIAATFIETIRWWIDGGCAESPEVITEYFYALI